jgi:hypothetical protein
MEGVVIVGPTIRVAGWRYQLPVARREVRVRAIRDGLLMAGWLAGGFVILDIPWVAGSLGYDAFASWSIDLNDPYARSMTGQYALGGFRYAPPIAFLLAPFGTLPWWLALWLWLGLLVGLVAFLGGRWSVALLALPPVALELYHGNVHLLIATAIAIGLRYPWAWAIVVLTKITPGVGLLWFLVRREWCALIVALAATMALAAVSLAFAPRLWADWAAVLAINAAQAQDLSVPPPLPFRLPAAIAIVVWGARTNRPWTVALAAMLALPILWPHGLVVALGAVPLLRQRARETGGEDTGIGVDLRALARPWPPGWQTVDRTASLRRLGWCTGVALAASIATAAVPIVRPVLQFASANLR